MIATDKPNPFQVLMLPISATPGEIVSQAENLKLLAETKEEEMLLQWAAEQLLTHQRIRLEYELFELPMTCYTDDAWETFVHQYRRRRVDLPAWFHTAPAPGLDNLNLAALAKLLLADLLILDKPDLEQAIEGTSLLPEYTLPLEEGEVICG